MRRDYTISLSIFLINVNQRKIREVWWKHVKMQNHDNNKLCFYSEEEAYYIKYRQQSSYSICDWILF